jgi:hypothetical protein
MTDKQKSYDFEQYQYGALAGRLAQSKESARFAPGALEILAGAKGLGLSDEAIKYHKSFGEQSPEQIGSAIRAYAGQFEEKRARYKPGELADWYQPVLEGLDQTEKDKIVAYLKTYDESLGQINENLEDASTISEASDRLYTPEKKAEAKRILERYQPLAALLQTLDSYKFESLRLDAVDSERVKKLKDLASKL